MLAMARKWLGFGGGTSKDGSKSYVKGKPSKETERVRKAYFEYKKKHPTTEKVSGLQRRMQSGGA
jgi:hypothetical protein